MDKVIARPGRRDAVEVNAIFDLLSGGVGVLASDDMNLDVQLDKCVCQVINMAGDAADDFGRILPA